MSGNQKTGTVRPLLVVLAEMMRGQRHSRHTISRIVGCSLPTADRWLLALIEEIPGVVRFKEGKIVWYEFRASSLSVPRSYPVRVKLRVV